MRASGGIVFIVIGLIALYIGATGKYKCLMAMLDCLAVDNNVYTGQPDTPTNPSSGLQKQSTNRTFDRSKLPGVLTPPFI